MKSQCSQQHRSSTKVSNLSAVRKQWSDVQMKAALESVIKDGLSQNRAADLHGVPRSTLKDRLSGRVIHGTNPGPQSYLSSSEELELAALLVDAAKMGYGRTRRDVKCLIETHLQINGKKGENFTVSNGWCDRFLKRHPNLSFRSSDSTAGVQMDALSKKNLESYFELLKSVYDKYDFYCHPEAIYMDETGVPLEPCPPKVVARRGQKKVQYRTSGTKAQITVIGCGSATGQVLPPFIIFAAKQLNPFWMSDEVSGSRYAVSNKGWIDQDLFFHWMQEYFITNAVSHRPLLLNS